jgi:protein SCO1/2
MRRVILLAAAVLVAALLGVLAARLVAPPAEGPTLPRGGDFTLNSADGPVALERLRGKVVLLYFGYASCPDVCPTSLALTTAALKTLAPAELERVQVLFISVDPGRDTPEKLKQYAGYFHPNIAGVTGRPETIAAVAARYGASYRMTPVESAAGYVVDHSSVTSVIAPDGRLVEQLPHGTTPPEIVDAIRRWLPH